MSTGTLIISADDPSYPPTVEELAQYNRRRRAENEQQMADAEAIRNSDPVLSYAMFLRTFEDEVRRLTCLPCHRSPSRSGDAAG